MTGKPRGLEASIWAGGPFSTARARTYHATHRSRSVPPQEIHHSVSPAPRPPCPAPQSAAVADTCERALGRAQAFQRFEQACNRLRWKAIDLENSYSRAMNPPEAGFAPADAETNFKVDFYEFYSWIEQALVLVLHVLGVAVLSRSSRPSGLAGGGGPGHAFHHNVLLALQDEGAAPLRDALGDGETNQALWKAKELRNRWKDAAGGKETPPLKMYDLRWIVGRILSGLDAAYGVATMAVRDGGVLREGGDDGEVQEGWEWMVDAMDWEA